MKTAERLLPDPAAEPTIAVARAAAIVGISTRHGYAAAERGEWPSIKVGRSVRIPTARWLRIVGLVEEAPKSASKADTPPVSAGGETPSHAHVTTRRRSRGAREPRQDDPGEN